MTLKIFFSKSFEPTLNKSRDYMVDPLTCHYQLFNHNHDSNENKNNKDGNDDDDDIGHDGKPSFFYFNFCFTLVLL